MPLPPSLPPLASSDERSFLLSSFFWKFGVGLLGAAAPAIAAFAGGGNVSIAAAREGGKEGECGGALACSGAAA